MITKEYQPNIDPGLTIAFDGKKYMLLANDEFTEYPIGSLICEYMRLFPDQLKKIIMSCDGLDESVTVESIEAVFKQLQTKLHATFPPVIAIMVELELTNTLADWFKSVREDRIKEFLEFFDTSGYESISEYILKDTNVSAYGGDTVLQLLLTCYFSFSKTYVVTKAMFLRVIGNSNDKDEDNAVSALAAMYGAYFGMQHIDYRIVATKQGLESLYTIKTSLSLLIFEMAQCMNTGAKIIKCKHCGNYFVPKGNANSVYCSYPVRDNRGKTCKDVGAQVTRANKEKSDIATKEYRKVYMRYKMIVRRHPEDKEAADQFAKLKSEVKTWREKLETGSSETEEFLKWLHQF